MCWASTHDEPTICVLLEGLKGPMASTTVGGAKRLHCFSVGKDMGWAFKNLGLQLKVPAS